MCEQASSVVIALETAWEKKKLQDDEYGQALIQFIEYVLALEEDDKAEHIQNAKDNDEPLLFYYCRLLQDWYEAQEEGWIVDEEFNERKKRLQEAHNKVHRKKVSASYPEEPAILAKRFVSTCFGLPETIFDSLNNQALMEAAHTISNGVNSFCQQLNLA